MSGGSPWTGSPVRSSSVINKNEARGENDSDLHHSHVKGGDLPEAGAVHLLRTNLLQDDAGLVYITIEGGQVERCELVPEVISKMSVTQIDHDHLTHSDLAEKGAPLLATMRRCLVSSPRDWTQRCATLRPVLVSSWTESLLANTATLSTSARQQDSCNIHDHISSSHLNAGPFT